MKAQKLPHLVTHLRSLRNDRGLTQNQLAVHCGVSLTTISNLEQATQLGELESFKLRTLLQITRGLGVTLDDLIPSLGGER